MEKAAQRLKALPQVAVLVEEVLHAGSINPCSSPLYVFQVQGPYNSYTALRIWTFVN
jgi:hypothetical protein